MGNRTDQANERPAPPRKVSTCRHRSARLGNWSKHLAEDRFYNLRPWARCDFSSDSEDALPVAHLRKKRRYPGDPEGVRCDLQGFWSGIEHRLVRGESRREHQVPGPTPAHSEDPSASGVDPGRHAALVAEMNRLIDELSSSLATALAVVSPSSLGARELARRLSINKMLGWRCFLLAHEKDRSKVLRNLPSPRTWGQVQAGLANRGLHSDLARSFATTLEAFESLIVAQGLPRRRLADWTVDRLIDPIETEDSIRGRRHVFDANVGFYGHSNEGIIGTYLVARSLEDPNLVSLAAAQIVLGPSTTVVGDEMPVYAPMQHWPEIESTEGFGMFPHLVRECSSPDLPLSELRRLERGSRPVIGWCAEDAGPSRRVFLSFLEWREAAHPVHAENRPPDGGASKDEGDEARLLMPIETPVACLVFELLIHRDVPLGGEVVGSLLFARPPRAEDELVDVRSPVRMPIRLEPEVRSTCRPSWRRARTPIAVCSRWWRFGSTRGSRITESTGS